MERVAATRAKAAFRELVDGARREPVTIERRERPVAILLSVADYERLEAAEDALWALRAERVAGEGFATPEESEAFLAGLRDARE